MRRRFCIALSLSWCLAVSGTLFVYAARSEALDRRPISTDPDAVRTLGSYVFGPRLAVCFAVKSADVVVHGTIDKRAAVQVEGRRGSWRDALVSVSVAHTWMAPSRDSLWIRILTDAETAPDSVGERPFFGAGKECVFFLTMDEQGELVGGPGSVTLPDTLVHWTFGVPSPSSSAVVAIVDSCVALWSLPEIARQSDLIIEGTILSCTGRHQRRTLVLEDTIVHKGTFALDTLRLASNPKSLSPSPPSFREGERVVLLAAGGGRSLFDLVGGWRGAWVFRPDGRLERWFHDPWPSLGAVVGDSPLRPSRGATTSLSRSEFMAAVEGAGGTLSN